MPIFWLLRVNRRDEQFSVFYSVRFSWWFCNFAAEWKSLVIENPVDRSRPNHNLKSRRWKWQSLQQGVNWLIGMAAPRKVTRRPPLVFCFENSDFGWLASIWWEHSASIVPSAISFWISFFFFFFVWSGDVFHLYRRVDGWSGSHDCFLTVLLKSSGSVKGGGRGFSDNIVSDGNIWPASLLNMQREARDHKKTNTHTHLCG